jgi:hypothetical protein
MLLISLRHLSKYVFLGAQVCSTNTLTDFLVILDACCWLRLCHPWRAILLTERHAQRHWCIVVRLQADGRSGAWILSRDRVRHRKIAVNQSRTFHVGVAINRIKRPAAGWPAILCLCRSAERNRSTAVTVIQRSYESVAICARSGSSGQRVASRTQSWRV